MVPGAGPGEHRVMTGTDDDLIGRDLRDRDHRSVGRITAVYRYPADTGVPAGIAAAVTRGVLRRSNLVDLDDADIDPEAVTVPHPRTTITSAPNFAPLLGDTLSAADALALYGHYWGAPQNA